MFWKVEKEEIRFIFPSIFSETYKKKRTRDISDKRTSEEMSFHTQKGGECFL